MAKMWPLLLLAVLSSCNYDSGFKIKILPKNAISSECFVKTVEETIPDIKFEGEKKTEYHLHFNFRMSDQFKDKLEALDAERLARRVGAIESSFRLNGELVTEILFTFLYSEKKIPESVVGEVRAIAKPYWTALRGLPQQLKNRCGLDSRGVDIKCTGKLCD